ncbi:MAG: hypothetical protein JW394_0702 [Nitrospira sp.]|nr:hypothetical protein [Nitrospira sp.]
MGRFLLILLLTVVCVHARINVVSLPGRDSVQLTIYNSADLTLVKETRLLTFKKGINRLEFSWANTLIDPTSVEFRALTNADKVDVLDASFPPRVTNTLEWRINSEVAGEVKVEIRYFTSGISWSADYVAEADRAEKLMQLAGSVRVNNRSGEDYENAQIRLVVGVIRLVEEIVDLARKGEKGDANLSGRLGTGKYKSDNSPGKDGVQSRLEREFLSLDALGDVKAREVVKESLGEYFLYTVEGRDTVANGWSKRLPSFVAKEVPIISYYKYERERWGDSVMRYYKFTNAVPSKLGKEPLPDGNVMAFRTVADDKLYSFVGRTSVKYIPIAETVELELGNDAEVLVKPTLMDWVKAELAFDGNGNVKGWTTKETWKFEVQNSKEIDVVLDIRRNFAGDWGMVTEQKFEKVDATKVKFVLNLKPREVLSFTYKLTTRLGSNVTK